VSPLFANSGIVDNGRAVLNPYNSVNNSSILNSNQGDVISQLEFAYFGCTYCKETITTIEMDSNYNIIGYSTTTTYTKGACGGFSSGGTNVEKDCDPKEAMLKDNSKTQ